MSNYFSLKKLICNAGSGTATGGLFRAIVTYSLLLLSNSVKEKEGGK
jgi:hypothetical protein